MSNSDFRNPDKLKYVTPKETNISYECGVEWYAFISQHIQRSMRGQQPQSTSKLLVTRTLVFIMYTGIHITRFLCVPCQRHVPCEIITSLSLLTGILYVHVNTLTEAPNQSSRDNVAPAKEQQAITQIYSKHTSWIPAELYSERNMTFPRWQLN